MHYNPAVLRRVRHAHLFEKKSCLGELDIAQVPRALLARALRTVEIFTS
jgi:hypothetical protein